MHISDSVLCVVCLKNAVCSYFSTIHINFIWLFILELTRLLVSTSRWRCLGCFLSLSLALLFSIVGFVGIAGKVWANIVPYIHTALNTHAQFTSRLHTIFQQIAKNSSAYLLTSELIQKLDRAFATSIFEGEKKLISKYASRHSTRAGN